MITYYPTPKKTKGYEIHTPFKTKPSESHTVSGHTSPLMSDEGVPPPPGGPELCSRSAWQPQATRKTWTHPMGVLQNFLQKA